MLISLSVRLAVLGWLLLAAALTPAHAKPTPAPQGPPEPTIDFDETVIRPLHGEQIDSQPPYTGPGYSVALGGTVPLAFTSNGVRLLSWFPVTTLDLNATSANTCWGYTSPSGREYAIIGISNGTAWVEVTDPGDARLVAFRSGPTSLWRDMKVFGTFCYCVSEGGGGIQVFDMANIDNGVVTLVRSVTAGGGLATHTVFVNEQSGYLYRCGGQSTQTYGLRIYDLNADPSNPTFVGEWNNRYVHEVQVVNWTQAPYAGREIAFVAGNDVSNGGNPRINILDVTNKQAITQISVADYPNGSFSHQAWLSTDRRYMYHNDELDEASFNLFSQTRIFDIANLAAPVYVGAFSTGLTNIDHNLYTKGNMIFESNYRAGLRIFDATNPIAPVEVAFFDTYPEDDNPNFNGLWNNYPFFNSGTIIGSDIEKGLFVWRMGEPELSFELPDGAPTSFPAQGGSVRVRITPAPGQSVMPGSPRVRLAFSNSLDELETPLTSLGGDLYRATIPPTVCGTQIRYYFSARSGTGLTAREPSTAPTSRYSATAATAQAVGFEDTFQTNSGWTVGNPGVDNATAGVWVRADPVGTSAQPEDDATPAPGTICWITGNGSVGGSVGQADVDGGQTTLTSPLLNAIAQPGVPLIQYSRWYSNDQGASPNQDFMPVSISNDGGFTWVALEAVSENARQWVQKTFTIADFVEPTDRIRLRFVAQDTVPASVVEAGVDDVRIVYVDCTAVPPACPGDADGDLDRDFADVTSVLTAFGASYGAGNTGPGDANRDGSVNFADITSVLQVFGVPCS